MINFKQEHPKCKTCNNRADLYDEWGKTDLSKQCWKMETYTTDEEYCCHHSDFDENNLSDN